MNSSVVAALCGSDKFVLLMFTSVSASVIDRVLVLAHDFRIRGSSQDTKASLS